jgi:hypothetical protein
MVPRTNVMTASGDWITVVFDGSAHINLVLTKVAFESFAYTSAWICYIDALALPCINVVMTDCVIVTGRTQTLIHIHVAVS